MKLAISLICLGLLVAATSLQAQEQGDLRKGRVLAREVCAACHAIEKGRPSPNAGAPTFEAIASSPGMSGRALAVALRRAHRTMPNFVIEGEELTNIIVYILSFKSPD
jgi:mono/diheme cytochrome c family protein